MGWSGGSGDGGDGWSGVARCGWVGKDEEREVEDEVENFGEHAGMPLA